ncbi:MAG: L-2-amino-thiazoline-4-carboxylic acid hydrolase, partial [Bacteroidales bacterium]
MKKQSSSNCSRRIFLTGFIPATCCLFSVNSLLASASESNPVKYDHKFDNLMDEKISYRESLSLRFEEFINIIQELSKEWGKDKVIEFLKKKGEERGYNRGQHELKNSKDNSFASFIKYLENPSYDNTLTFKYVEKTDTVCEIKITECLWAEVFKKEKAEAEGY